MLYVVFFSCMKCNVVSSFSSFFFFKQKTAYDMRISDWSSDVCSSDLLDAVAHENVGAAEAGRTGADNRDFLLGPAHLGHVRTPALLEIGRASCRERVCQYV